VGRAALVGINRLRLSHIRNIKEELELTMTTKPNRAEIVDMLVNRFMDTLSLEDALEYVANDMTDYFNRMTIDELLRELQD